MKLMLLRALIALLLAPLIALLPAIPASAQQALEGSWAFQIEEAVIFRFDIAEGEDDNWSGIWTRPASFHSNGVLFTQMSGSEEVRSMAGLEFAGQVELSFDDPRPGAIPDIFRFELTGEDTAILTYVGTQLAPYPLVKVDPATPLAQFVRTRAYHRRNARERPEAGDAPIGEEQQPDAQAIDKKDQPHSEPPRDEAPAPAVGDDFLDGL